MKAAFDWKARKNKAQGLEDGADKILHFKDAFHGRSGYTLSVTNTDPLKTDYFPKFDWPRISNPWVHFPMDEAAVTAAEEKACREIEAAFAADPHGIAGILIEPIQGEGGDKHFRDEFIQKLRAYADQYDALLIFDEVQTGLGATGTTWAFQQMGVTPDLVAFGKKTQVCGVMCTRRVDEVEDNVFHLSSRINSTWGGNLVDMVRSARMLEIIEEDNLVENAAKVGAYFKGKLEELGADFEQVSNVRGRGLFLAFDLPDGEQRDAVRTKCWEAGFATLTCGPQSVRFRPSLTFTEGNVDTAIGILREVLS
jgi:L-lysine 6-transaminase